MAYPPPPPPGPPPPAPVYEHATHEKVSHIPGFGEGREDDLPSLKDEGAPEYPPSFTYPNSYPGYYPGSYPASAASSYYGKHDRRHSAEVNNNQNCCWNACYDPCRLKQLFQSPCQIGVIPMRSAAFQAPRIPLPKLCQHLLPDCCEEDEDEEDGVAFQFKPQKNCRTEVTFTIEPRPQPPWLTMMNCGFKPMVNCSAPPCYLSNDGNPGIDYLGGSQSFVNRSFGSQVSYGGLANYPTLDQLSKSFTDSHVVGLKKADGGEFESKRKSKDMPKPEKDKAPETVPMMPPTIKPPEATTQPGEQGQGEAVPTQPQPTPQQPATTEPAKPKRESLEKKDKPEAKKPEKAEEPKKETKRLSADREAKKEEQPGKEPTPTTGDQSKEKRKSRKSTGGASGKKGTQEPQPESQAAKDGPQAAKDGPQVQQHQANKDKDSGSDLSRSDDWHM